MRLHRTGEQIAVLLLAAAAAACSRAETRAVPAAQAKAATPAVSSARAAPVAPNGAGALDPLQPNRPPAPDSSRVIASDWVKARPEFQSSRKPEQRGGVEPCSTQQADTSAFESWTPLQMGHFTAPRENPLDAAGHFNLVIHFHGDEPVLRELALSKQRFVLYTLSLDPGQNYGTLITSAGLFEAIVAGTEQALSKRTGKVAKVGHIALSAWSAGFSGVAAVIAQPNTPRAKAVDGVVLIDGLHAARDPVSFEAQLKPFVDYAQRAAAGDGFFFFSHSSILPTEFASTTECAHYLESALGGKPQPVRREDAAGLELVELFSKGNAHIRGYAGNDKADHCAQLFLLRDAFSALSNHWAAH